MTKARVQKETIAIEKTRRTRKLRRQKVMQHKHQTAKQPHQGSFKHVAKPVTTEDVVRFYGINKRTYEELKALQVPRTRQLVHAG